MNERIKELFKRAGGKTSARNLASNPVQVVETHELWDDRIEKFAELIVKECMNVILLDGKTIADAMPDANRDNYTMVAEQTGMINGSMRYANKIKQHFGVE